MRASNLGQRTPSWFISVGIHGLFVVVWVFLNWQKSPKTKQVSFEVIEQPKLSPQPLVVRTVPPPVKPKVEPKPMPERRPVFGINKKAILAADSESQAPEVKLGNTVAKAPDELKLQPGEDAALPFPVDDYLVSAMPVLRSEVRVSYPEEARRAGIQGPVVMDLLIDPEGNVRKVTLVQGLDELLDSAATAAAEKFLFQPARVNDQAVAVRIRYTYRFVLENR